MRISNWAGITLILLWCIVLVTDYATHPQEILAVRLASKLSEVPMFRCLPFVIMTCSFYCAANLISRARQVSQELGKAT